MDDFTSDEEELERDYHRVRTSRLVRDGIIRRFQAKIERLGCSREETFDSDVSRRRRVNIFISYCWDWRRETVHEMAKQLGQNDDIKICIDLQNEKGSPYEFIAKGIREADLVLCCHSRKYAENRMCRREIEYAFFRKKAILPVALERAYKPDGWLLNIFKSQLFFSYNEDETFQEAAAKISTFILSVQERRRTAALAAMQEDAATGKQEKTNEEQVFKVPTLDLILNGFKTVGIPAFSKSRYCKVEGVESRILKSMNDIAYNPYGGCLLVCGDSGVGKTTLLSHVLTDPKRQTFFIKDCLLNRVIWINCSQWRNNRFDKNAFTDEIIRLVNELEAPSTRSANYFTNLKSIAAYFEMKNLRFAFLFDDLPNSEPVKFLFESEFGPRTCFAVTRDPAEVLNSDGLVQKVERFETWAEEDIRNLLKMTFKLEHLLNAEQTVGLVKRCHGLPIIARLFSSRILNCCEDGEEIASEYNALTLVQNMPVFQTVSKMFNFGLDQLDPSFQPLYYSFLLFNPSEQIPIFDLAALWGFDLDDESRCGLRGVCRAFEKRCVIRRLRKHVRERGHAQLDEANEDKFFVHELFFEATLERAKTEFPGFQKEDDQECLRLLRSKLIMGDIGSEEHDDKISVLFWAVKHRRQKLVERIVKLLDAKTLAELCARQSVHTNCMTFVQYLYRYAWEPKSRRHSAISRNISYRLLRKFLEKLDEFNELWPVVKKTQSDNQFSSLLSDVLDDAKTHSYSKDRAPLVAKLHRWFDVYLETKWEASLFDDLITKTEPIAFNILDGDLDKVNKLAENYSTNKNVQGQCTQIAARRGKFEILQFLTEKWPETIKIVDEDGRLPILLASRNGHLETVKYLHGKWPGSVKAVDVNGRSAILWSAKHGHLDCVRFLYEVDPETVMVQDLGGISTLMAAAGDGHLEIVRYLVEKMPRLMDLREKRSNESALGIAASFGKLDVVKYLYRRFQTTHYPSVFSAAVAMGQVDVVNFMLQESPNIAREGDASLKLTPLMLAAASGHFECVKALHGKCDDYVTTPKGSQVTALMAAAKGGHYEIVQWLFFNCPDTAKVEMPDGESAITIAEKMGHAEIAKFLKDNAY